MKAQLSIEYMIAFGIFISIAAYTYLQYTNVVPIFIEEIRKEDKRIQAYQLSELLVNDVGEPRDWQNAASIDGIKRIGLSDEIANQTNNVSLSKINRLNNDLCGPSSNLQKWTGIDRTYNIFIFKIDQTDNGKRILLVPNCKVSNVRIDSLNFTVRRYMSYVDASNENQIAELIIQG